MKHTTNKIALTLALLFIAVVLVALATGALTVYEDLSFTIHLTGCIPGGLCN
jgi:hypothetical protein